ncbi:hypothetical protein BAY59_19720 [Prauserella coralliicola]|uniref:hypothetical protein n=1 Tax=Amycolatopsis keratiniphila TaxID=129921 RepID=UPI0005C1F6B2|nr:hypothetical protein [Amycolatopsis keratiniphila]OLZ51842.1 hypothetical protein BS330_24620 [Amycolatopsis keratiniphila subsp. nogabecina]PXY25811.1 hypothetical protein BAY59_19720 [Prauserella coralliicola]SDU62554.1 hypothetical protein SAMN04489733_7238 [Amycolatopsis keratiniphila]
MPKWLAAAADSDAADVCAAASTPAAALRVRLPILTCCLRSTCLSERLKSVSLDDDAVEELDLVLGQTHHLLGEAGDELAQRLVQGAKLTLRRDGGYFHPTPGDNWRSDTYEAVFEVAPSLVPEFTSEIVDRIWSKLEPVLRQHGRQDVFGVVVEPTVPPLPEVAADWRAQAEQPPVALPGNQARRERANGGYPVSDGLTFGSRAEIVVYELLVELQRACSRHRAIAMMPLPAAKLRDAGVRTPDFIVLGNGRAVVIEVDGPHHYGTTRKADDADRDRHWDRCGVHTIRIGAHHTDEPAALKELLREELDRWLFQTR